jgi:hypothetical protein
MNNITVTVNTVTTTCKNALAIGEPPISIVTPNLRISAAVVARETITDSNFSLTVAQSDVEKLSNSITASMRIDASGLGSSDSLGVALVQYTNNPKGVITNATAVTVSSTVYSETAQAGRRLATDTSKGGKYLVLNNVEPMTYLSIEPSVLQIKCITPRAEPYTVEAVCPSGYAFSVECPADVKGNFNISCDGRWTRPICTSYDGTAYTQDPDCEVVAYTALTTTCFCQGSSASGLRRLQAASSEGVSYATSLEVQNIPFNSEFLHYPLPSPVVRHHAVLYSVYSTAALFIVALVGIAMWRRRQMKKKKESAPTAVAKPLGRSIRSFFLSALPEEFRRGEMSWRLRLVTSVLDHHSFARVWNLLHNRSQNEVAVYGDRNLEHSRRCSSALCWRSSSTPMRKPARMSPQRKFAETGAHSLIPTISASGQTIRSPARTAVQNCDRSRSLSTQPSPSLRQCSTIAPSRSSITVPARCSRTLSSDAPRPTSLVTSASDASPQQ